jgi:hypothetical protein
MTSCWIAKPEELRAFARRDLACFKVPASWRFVGELPRNASGKILRRSSPRAADRRATQLSFHPERSVASVPAHTLIRPTARNAAARSA